MRCLVKTFFQDGSGKWHQPGNVADFGPGDAEGYEKRGFVKILETAVVQQPKTREVGHSQSRRQRK